MTIQTASSAIPRISAPPIPTVLTADAVDALPMQPLEGVVGVAHRVLWSTDSSTAGVMKVDAGHRMGPHAHRINHHHLWVLAGEADVLGHRLGVGSYAHIPSGVEHDIDATTTGGCTVFYLYLRHTD